MHTENPVCDYKHSRSWMQSGFTRINSQEYFQSIIVLPSSMFWPKVKQPLMLNQTKWQLRCECSIRGLEHLINLSVADHEMQQWEYVSL